MAGIRWGLFFSFGFFLSPVCVSAEQQHSQGGFRRLFVLQPGPGAAGATGGGGVRVSSISTRHGAAGRPHTYNVELTANFGGQVRTRRMGNQAATAPQFSPQQQQQQQQQKQLVKLSGQIVSHAVGQVMACGRNLFLFWLMSGLGECLWRAVLPRMECSSGVSALHKA
ncbi:hypothetical protein EYF80_031466 [Liparis tanakae]|uniref:Uncharacterized protein n=1 Tax=Liparis tanakae TaxID=230148 RepID=A0A4Z2H0H8_9TELE|nr:hypothetical protein EYF80_031466 [Liparis tanakae]